MFPVLYTTSNHRFYVFVRIPQTFSECLFLEFVFKILMFTDINFSILFLLLNFLALVFLLMGFTCIEHSWLPQVNFDFIRHLFVFLLVEFAYVHSLLNGLFSVWILLSFALSQIDFWKRWLVVLNDNMIRYLLWSRALKRGFCRSWE